MLLYDGVVSFVRNYFVAFVHVLSLLKVFSTFVGVVLILNFLLELFRVFAVVKPRNPIDERRKGR